jgi:hypothetical protein
MGLDERRYHVMEILCAQLAKEMDRILMVILATQH